MWHMSNAGWVLVHYAITRFKKTNEEARAYLQLVVVLVIDSALGGLGGL